MDNQIIDKVFSIGRSGNNDFALPLPQISGFHARIQCLSENTFLVEDNNSSNGTFVNGLRIRKAVCSRQDQLCLADYEFNFNSYFPPHKLKKEIQEKFQLPPEQPVKPAQKQNANDFTVEFAELDMVYRVYNETKLSLQGKGSLKMNLIRSTPGIALGGVLTLLFPQVMGMFIVGSSVGSLLGIFLSKSTSDQEKMLALDDEFKINYICPKCKNFLGFVPWQSLANKKTCDRCKAIWVK